MLKHNLLQPHRDFFAAFGHLEDGAGGVAALADLGDDGGQVDLLGGDATLEIVVEKAVQVVDAGGEGGEFDFGAAVFADSNF